MSLGTRIKNLRTEKGMTLPKLAEESGVSKGFLSQLENDETANPSLETLSKISKALGVTSGALLGEKIVQAKQMMPEKIEAELEEFIKDRRSQGQVVDVDILRALYPLQERKGTGRKTKQDWAFLYESIERVHNKKA